MPELVVRQHRFACRDRLPPFVLMQLAGALKSEDGFVRLGGMYEFVRAQIEPGQWPRFETAMHALDEEEDFTLGELDAAIGALMTGYSARPTERPSNSPSGAGPTGGPSRVVSLSRGTAETEQTSSPAGERTGS
ncbi:MAG: hypothetical protein AB7L91_06275 [Dehalococcoidia bacterium]